MLGKIIKFSFAIIIFFSYSCSSNRNVSRKRFDSYNGGSEYALKYGKIAVQESQRSGVPASITLAQGILESGNGKSTLARKSNNHFGIKCHKDWNGKRVYHDDDEENECFRKYKNVFESYLDHSNFLIKHDRYEFLFDYKKADYKKWAKGLKKAGYATSPTYAKSLIKLIEKYDLTHFDNNKKNSKNRKFKKTKQNKFKNRKFANKNNKTKISPKKNKKTNSIISSKTGKEKIQTQSPNTEDSNISESEIVLSDTAQEYLIDNTFKTNGLFYVENSDKISLADIAFFYNLDVKDLFNYNDSKNDIINSNKIYIEEKKINAEYKFKYHIFKKDETMLNISQKYGVKLTELYKKNNINFGVQPEIGTQLILRGKKSDYINK